VLSGSTCGCVLLYVSCCNRLVVLCLRCCVGVFCDWGWWGLLCCGWSVVKEAVLGGGVILGGSIVVISGDMMAGCLPDTFGVGWSLGCIVI